MRKSLVFLLASLLLLFSALAVGCGGPSPCEECSSLQAVCIATCDDGSDEDAQAECKTTCNDAAAQCKTENSCS